MEKLSNSESGIIPRTDLINDLSVDIYPNLHEDKIKSRLRKSIDKLSKSGCVNIRRNIFECESRGSIYSLTDDGKIVWKEIESEQPEVYVVA